VAIVKNFSLDGNADKDILRWLEGQPNQSAAIREALRYFMLREGGVSLADVMAEIRALPSRLRLVAVSSDQVEISGEEPAAAAANLDDLLSRLDTGALEDGH
jgi:hypothetical protein